MPAFHLLRTLPRHASLVGCKDDLVSKGISNARLVFDADTYPDRGRMWDWVLSASRAEMAGVIHAAVRPYGLRAAILANPNESGARALPRHPFYDIVGVANRICDTYPPPRTQARRSSLAPATQRNVRQPPFADARYGLPRRRQCRLRVESGRWISASPAGTPAR